jgi:magnesium transporter
MSNKKIDLALAFLQSQPDSAASVLEQQPIEYVAEFLRNIPFAHAASVLKRMLPQYTAAICKQLEPNVSANFLSEMDISLIAAIMRYSDKGLREKILKLLPERSKIACNLLLLYTEDEVGAWMMTGVMTLPDDCTVQKACQRIGAEQDIIDTDAIYVVDRQRRIQGSIVITKLLRAAPETPIMSVMKKNPYVISGRTAIISAINHHAWTKGDTVAIINNNHQMVGILRHVDLRRGLDEISNTITRPNNSDTITGVCEAYGASLLALLNIVGEAAGTNE